MKTDVVVLLVPVKKPKEAQSVTGCTGSAKYGHLEKKWWHNEESQ